MKMYSKGLILFFLLVNASILQAQKILAPTPPMGYMTWNFYADKITEADVKGIADALVSSGLRDLGFDHVFIDDGWQGGRDNKNNIIPDPKKFPAGMKALADYVHGRGVKLGIYSDAAPLTCAGYTASLGFEQQDAKTFAAWGIDYLKYDYCHAPADWETAIKRYSAMSAALKNSGRDIAFGICEWGDREPWLWAKKAGGQLWRMSADVRDKWKSLEPAKNAHDLHRVGAGILDILNLNAPLHAYAGPGAWNDMDMLVVGLNGKKGPSGDLGGVGCTETEYQTQMSMWCMMAAPLMITCDILNMSDATKRILMNKKLIAINQDKAGKQAERILHTAGYQVYKKPLANGDVAFAVLNHRDSRQAIRLSFAELGIGGFTKAEDLWAAKPAMSRLGKQFSRTLEPHETVVLLLSK